MAELAEEDDAFEAELEPALAKAETQFEDVRAAGDDERQAGRGQRHRVDQAGGRRDGRLRLRRDALPDVHPVGPAARVSRSRTRTRSRTWRPASRASRSGSSGEYAYGYMQSEIGVHRLVRMSPFGSGRHAADVVRGRGRGAGAGRHIEIEIKDADLIMQTFCSGGPGGQHQNKTQSGVRLIHKPTASGPRAGPSGASTRTTTTP